MAAAKEPNKFVPPKVRRPRKEVDLAVHQLEDTWGFTVCGSYRRGKDTVGDLDVLVPPHLDFEEQIETMYSTIGYETLRSGAMKSEGTVIYDGSPLLLNLWRVPSVEAWGGMLVFATGPWDMNIMMRAKAKGRGWLLSQYGLFEPQRGPNGGPTLEQGTPLEVEDKQLDVREAVETDTIEELRQTHERPIFKLLDLDFVVPTDRDNWREILHPNRQQDDVITVPIMSSNGVDVYHVDVKNGKGWHCECKGFQYRSHCRHLAEAEAMVRSGYTNK